ncbi:MAG: HAD family phosphatase [Firmicutes bacterium]|nr:HAD family phosphatase [Bacillota bacterium]
MKIKLVALDIDGTILNSEGELSTATEEAVAKVKQRGISVVLATGRRLARTLPWAEALNLKGPLIVHNGAVVFDQEKKETVLKKGIDFKSAQEIIEQLNQAKINYLVYTGESAGENLIAPYYTTPEFEELMLRYMGEAGQKVRKMELGEGPIRISVIDQREKINPFYKSLSRFEQKINAMFFGAGRSRWRGVEIVSGGCSKGTGLLYVAERQKVKQKEILAIGDNINDLEMITWAGVGVAMGGGSSLLQKRADFVAPGSSRDGAAWILNELLLKK